MDKTARLDKSNCTNCNICVRVCPVTCITAVKSGRRTTATIIDEDNCQACTICATRCPEHAITMIKRDRPLVVGITVDEVTDEINDICRRAHMYPDQVVCFCHRVRAKEVVAAILGGAETPEAVSQQTGARTGCGVLCITGIMRTLRAAGLQLTEAPGWQWYNMPTTIWTISPEIAKKYRLYYVDEDRKAIDKMFPGGEEQ